LHGSRENVDASRAAALVEESLSQLSQDIANLAAAATVAVSHEDSNGGEGALAARMTCRRVQLSNKSLSEEAAIVVAKALLQLGQDVEHADISDIIAGKHEVEALKVLEIGQMRVEAGRRQ
jgi:Ran GTPase-activating protein (RanGAP) involved in mRNA processing and transport